MPPKRVKSETFNVENVDDAVDLHRYHPGGFMFVHVKLTGNRKK